MRVNGADVTASNPAARLSALLRNDLGLSATKVGCDAGDCGACTVLVDGAPVCACLTATGQVAQGEVTTLEGLADDPMAERLRASFLHHGAAQCGICTPGMIVSAVALLRDEPRPSRVQVEDALGGVLCRCTGYAKIVDAVMSATTLNAHGERPSAGASIGSAIRHLDGAAKVAGTLAYGNDALPAGALLARVIRSPHPHAGFTFGDTQAYLESQGLTAWFDASDIPGKNCFGVIPPLADQPVFAEGVARYRGEAVACIVGEPATVRALREADFPVTWDVRAQLMTPEEALDGALLHPNRAGNVLVTGLVQRGDAEAALAGAAHVATVETSTPFIEHAYIEPEAGWAERKGERIEVHGCTQAATMDREELSAIMALDMDAVRVSPSACGGGFGSKLDVSFQPYIALAAWRLNRPVAICYTRAESMRATTKRHPSEITLTVGCDADGTVSGFDFQGTFNTGAYASWGPTVANRVPVHASGPYHMPDYRARSIAVHTHCPPSGAFRGFGVPQSAIAQETAFDELADAVGMDRLAFRLKNALRDGQPTVTGQVFETGIGIEACLEVLATPWAEATERAAAYNRTANGSGLRKGIGIASCWYGCGNTSLPNPSTVRMGITAAGQVVLHQGAMDIGQGANTVITQIAADALGVRVHDIRIVDGDTDLTPDCGKTSASRQTYVTGSAAMLSGKALRAAVLRHANVGEDADLTLDGATLAVGDVARIDLSSLPVNAQGYVFMAEETYNPPVSALDENGQGVPYAVYGYGAQIVELTVDTKLGAVKLDHITTAHDVGRAINPLLIEGQIEGGVAQGIGLALMEDFIPGRTENLHDYLIPTFGDMPSFTHHIVEVPDAEGPYGAKGLGEHVLIPTAPAILNAIRHATGARVRHLPATPDRVLAAIREVT
jgi:CO/xanthine dehydrogenase Mo-binding subunit/aerobic-type carbon monoxide dehydrogenase small subunit (CoxS/CutS family)